jgi:hypothetical protein
MKKLRILLSVAAFVFATTAAITSNALVSSEIGIFGESFLGQCIEAEAFEQSGCGTSGIYQCSVYLEDSGSVPAFRIKGGTYDCAQVYLRYNQ